MGRVVGMLDVDDNGDREATIRKRKVGRGQLNIELGESQKEREGRKEDELGWSGSRAEAHPFSRSPFCREEASKRG